MNFNFSEQVSLKSDDELANVYMNASDFQPEFVEAAKREIINRNISLDSLNSVKTQKMETTAQELSIGKRGNSLYLLFIAFLALFGGIIAIIGGYIYAFSTKTDDLGNRYFIYDEVTRKRGQIIFFTDLAVLIITLLIRLD